MPKKQTIKAPMQYREATIDASTLTRAEGDEDSREFEIAVSSEHPVSRWFGTEVLDHQKKSVRLDRLNDSGPLLLDHDAREHHGAVVRAWVDEKNKVVRALVRMGQGPKRDEILQDVRDGIRRTVSVGYRIHKAIVEEIDDTEGETYRVTDWEPFEVTLTAVPADPTVGVGRSESDADCNPFTITRAEKMPKEKETGVTPEREVRVVDASSDQIEGAVRAEQKRVAKILEVGKKLGYRELADKAVAEGWPVEKLHEAILGELGAKRVEMEDHKPEEVGLTERERNDYSFLRMLRAQIFGNANKRFVEDAAFEIEVSRATADKFGQEPEGLLVAPDVLMHHNPAMGRAMRAALGRMGHRALTAGVAGASTIETSVLGESFIDILRNMTVLDAAGITILDGLVGDIAIPRQTGAGQHYWLANDTTDITESTQTLDQVPLTQRNIGALTIYTRQLLTQTAWSVEAWVRADLARVMAIGLDAAGLYGTGAGGQPFGVANTGGINAPPNFAAAVPTWPEVVNMETFVDADNALMGTLAYITDPTIRGGLKSAEKFSGSGREIWQPGDELNGYRGLVSNQVTAGDVFFGNWADLILGLWGGLDVMSNPYSLDARRNIKVSAIQSADYGVRHPESFALNNDGV